MDRVSPAQRPRHPFIAALLSMISAMVTHTNGVQLALTSRGYVNAGGQRTGRGTKAFQRRAAKLRAKRRR